MVDYVYLDNYTNSGKMGINRHVFEVIAENAVNKVKGASVSNKKQGFFQLYSPITCSVTSDGQINIKIGVKLKHGTNVNEICLKIQEEVANALMATCETVPFNITIKVDSIE
jgi:uncharacterized alkaline shock family protein YloU